MKNRNEYMRKYMADYRAKNPGYAAECMRRCRQRKNDKKEIGSK